VAEVGGLCLFEAFYAGCIPVLLSDGYTVPFEDFLDWTQFSIKWPMSQVREGLYEYLHKLLHEHWQRVQALHKGVRDVACWFDFHMPHSSKCSPYIGMMRQLRRRLDSVSDRSLVPNPLHKAMDGMTRYWF